MSKGAAQLCSHMAAWFHRPGAIYLLHRECVLKEEHKWHRRNWKTARTLLNIRLRAKKHMLLFLAQFPLDVCMYICPPQPPHHRYPWAQTSAVTSSISGIFANSPRLSVFYSIVARLRKMKPLAVNIWVFGIDSVFLALFSVQSLQSATRSQPW